MKTEISNSLRETKTIFAQQEELISSYSKLLDILQLQYSEQQMKLSADVYALIRNTDQAVKALPDETGDSKRIRELWSFAGKEAPMSLIQGDTESQSPFSPLKHVDLKSPLSMLRICEPTMVHHEIISSSSMVSGTAGHPIKNGTFGGELHDLIYRSVYLAAAEMTLQSIRADLLSAVAGSQSKKTFPTVQTMYLTIFVPRFKENLKASMDSRLSKDGIEELTKYSDLYEWANPLGGSK